MENCIFCKIVQGEIPASKVYEDEKVVAFLDLTQTTKGHTLLIPKEHVADIFEYDDVLAGEVFARIPKIARALDRAFPEMCGLNILNNNREVAYQSVFHSHIHLLPRYSEEDDFNIHFGDHSEDFTNEERTNVAEKIAQEVEK
ncbi:histidine triad (HIT) family protein [Pilibacter termitis]|uniref:Histidine triad (HIT) family protein n=1 Tax=Pilibacter termitis TaxID=263852 RepID=A0A1T4LDN0_9ENTE|nr:HIT family protein [Pilibacter termitis]SJZ52825.1 histidine triad (HIT) family protein [Pilibacter termitis]